MMRSSDSRVHSAVTWLKSFLERWRTPITLAGFVSLVVGFPGIIQGLPTWWEWIKVAAGFWNYLLVSAGSAMMAYQIYYWYSAVVEKSRRRKEEIESLREDVQLVKNMMLQLSEKVPSDVTTDEPLSLPEDLQGMLLSIGDQLVERQYRPIILQATGPNAPLIRELEKRSLITYHLMGDTFQHVDLTYAGKNLYDAMVGHRRIPHHRDRRST